jgi:cytochrome c-type biogenesis protein CcmH/NrfF
MRWFVPSLVGFALCGGVGAVEDLESRAKQIEGKLMAPCCMANPISDHHSGVADEMRGEIRSMLGAGKTEHEILERYVAQYGEQILALPSATGFNLAAYLLPFLMLAAGTLGMWFAIRRWSQVRPAAAPAGGPPAEIDPAYADRLQQRLRELD